MPHNDLSLNIYLIYILHVRALNDVEFKDLVGFTCQTDNE